MFLYFESHHKSHFENNSRNLLLSSHVFHPTCSSSTRIPTLRHLLNLQAEHALLSSLTSNILSINVMKHSHKMPTFFFFGL